MAEILVIATIVIMGLAMLLIMIPAVPVSMLQWALAMVYMALSLGLLGDTRMTLASGVIITLLALLGSTSGWWLPFLGLRGRNMSCMGLVAFFAGMVIGSIAIPIPFLGTIVGGVVGVIAIEYARNADVHKALRGGKTALKMVLFTMLAEFLFAGAIVGVFIITVLSNTN